MAPLLKRMESDDPTLTSCIVSCRKIRNHIVNCGMIRNHNCKTPVENYFRLQTEGDSQRLGEAIAANTKLSHLQLVKDSYGNLEAVHSNLHRNKSIRRLTFDEVYMSVRMMSSLQPFIEINPNLTSLTFFGCGLSSEAMCLLFSALSRMTSSLKYLKLSNDSISNQDLQLLVEALRTNHPKLRSLELNENGIDDRGCVSIASLLKSPSCKLIRLILDDNTIHNEGAKALANGLVENKHLKTLSINKGTAYRGIDQRGYNVFLPVVCNSPSIDGILGSNHKLERLGTDASAQLSYELKSSLRFNKSTYAASQKVVMYHLLLNFNMDLFETIPGSLIPSVLAMIADHALFSTSNNERTDADARTHREFVRKDFILRHQALHRIIRLYPDRIKVLPGNSE